MTEPTAPDLSLEHAVSRRNLFLGAGAAALAAGAAMSFTDVAGAAGLPAAVPHPAAFGAPIAGLTYLGIDALDLFPDGNYSGGNDPRYTDPTTGVGIAFTGGHTSGQLATSLPLPVGSVIRQINASFRGSSVILSVYEKPLATPNTPVQRITLSLDNGTGVRTQTLNLDGSTAALAPITIAAATTYTVRFYVGAGDTINGVTIGYTPPLSGFVPYTSGSPRVVDTRSGFGGAKLAAGEDRTVNVATGGAKFVVFNLAVTETAGAGFVGAFSGALATWPNNASINYASNDTVSNTVICAVSDSGQFKLHCGVSATHVVVDMIGLIY